MRAGSPRLRLGSGRLCDVAEPVGDDDPFERGIERARAALGSRRPRPVPVPDPAVDPPEPDRADPEDLDERDERIAALEAEVRRLRAALARIHQESATTLDR